MNRRAFLRAVGCFPLIPSIAAAQKSISHPFSPTDFTAGSNMIWTVKRENVETLRYRIDGDLMFLAFGIFNTSVGGKLFNNLRIRIPEGRLPPVSMDNTCTIIDNGNAVPGTVAACTGVPYLSIYKVATQVPFLNILRNKPPRNEDFRASNGKTSITGQITFQI